MLRDARKRLNGWIVFGRGLLLTHCDIGWIEMPQRSSPLPYWSVLSLSSGSMGGIGQ